MMDEKEKQLKSRNRWIFDYIATFWLISMMIPGAYIGHEYINPVVFRYHPNWATFNSYLLYYGLFMVTTNWLMIKLTNTETPENYHSETENSLGSASYCNKCNRYKPPRSHHCNLCKKCILKQDHHCFFTGTCIGYSNQRFFIVFTFWMSFGFVYCFFIAIFYSMSSDWRTLPWYDYVVLPLTILRFLFGYLSFYEIFCLFLAHSLCVAVYGANFVFISQVYLLCNGLTSYERKIGLKSPMSKLPLKDLLKITFGKYWFLNFIFPIGLFTKVDCKSYNLNYRNM